MLDVVNLGGFEFTLSFDPAIVHVESMTVGSFLTESGRSITPLGPEINNITGIATFGAFSFGAQPAPSGSGPVAMISFSPVAAGTSTLALSEAQLSDPVGNAIPVSVQEGSIVVLPALTGDFDCDCDVDVLDVMQVASRWKAVQGDPDYDLRYDLDSDGDIDVLDIMAVAGHWGEQCGT